jgi:hypothetical protein
MNKGSLSTLIAQLKLMLVALGIMKSMETESVPPVVSPTKVDTLVPWTGTENCRRNVRVLCDLEGLTEQQKDDLSATVHCESGYNPAAVNKNIDPKTGKLSSTDYGVAQINDFWHIGEGKDFPSVQYVLDNPEACIRYMCQQWKAGNGREWVCYLKNMYLNYSS